ncbi:unnamed protein product [Lactuca saligna]|uniref:Uncharacterized protein n=1 Tax=Lactuca saligna TaxID=75948 RepID=A0AA35YNS8_LACSI|nr:unnamed protein product [Lactuca saligna]
MYGSPKEVVDDPAIFTSVAHIPDAMLKKVDPTNNVLVSYLQSIDTTVVSGVLFDIEAKKSKKSKKTDVGSSKKKVKVEKQKKSPTVKPASVEESAQQIIFPNSTTVAATPTIEASQEKDIIPSKTGVFRQIKFKRKSSSQIVQKTQITHQGVMVREIPAPVSPSSKKRRVEDLAKFIKKNQRTKGEEKIPETPEVHIQEAAKISPPVTISKPADSRPVEQRLVISLPQVTSTTDSPTFQSIMDQPFTTIFSTQSTDPPNPSSPVDETMATDAGTDNEGFGGTFEALHFYTSEEDFPDHMLMTMKQFKILNSKLNSILQSEADVGSVGVMSWRLIH